MSNFPSNLKEDETLLARLLKSEWDRLRWRLNRQIPRSQQSAIDVDDVLQQTCVDVFLAINNVRIDDQRAFSAWFETVARRNLIGVCFALPIELLNSLIGIPLN